MKKIKQKHNKSTICVIVCVFIFLVSLIYPSKSINNEDLDFSILSSIYNEEPVETKLVINVRNKVSKEFDLTNFVITFYDGNKNMIVTSGANACIGEKEENKCVLKGFQSKRFNLIVGVDARNISYIEYSLD